MREGENDMWVWGQGHMGRSGEGLGTVQVRWRCTGVAGEGVAILAGNGVKGESARWDKGHMHMGGWVEGVGTVWVRCRCTGREMGKMGVQWGFGGKVR
nr:hypothetical protein [Tanacetum cinerariifolium]